jgi:hypothetical protein
MHVIATSRRRSRSRQRKLLPAAFLGLVGCAPTRNVTQASHASAADSSNPEQTIHAIVTERAFDSNELPAVKLEAPEGWRLEFDSVKRSIVAIRRKDWVSPATTFRVMSSVISDEPDVDRMLAMTSKGLEDRGLTKGDSFRETIDGLSAAGRILHNETEEVCLWFVKRGPHLASALMCESRRPMNAREACKPVLERLKWREVVLK